MSYALIFPGQGSQSLGMGKDFYENSLKAKALLDEASEYSKIDFKRLLFTQNDDLNKSEFTQPAVVLTSLMAYVALLEREPEFHHKIALGHSLGEFSALAVNGAFEFLEAITLVHKRGIYMQEDCARIEAGMMVILGLKDAVVEALCDEAQGQGKSIFAANYNCDGQIVVAGLKSHLLEYEMKFKEAGAKRAMLLNMSVASHCPLLSEASNKLSKELERIVKPNFLPVLSNVTAKPYESKSEALNLLKAQLVSPVLYKQSIQNTQDEVDFFVELGASVLKGLNKKITTKETYALTNLNEIDEFLKVVK
ncbi:ACP S-malonyltransferase [Campylobacter helveticus]|uniref:Malonyl CoA-acyl carrier protein transacylase n=3 Tax=Campylobacter helveticus TaxID=28898 RepID=A0ABY3L2R2_9BACT|nr:malonyl-CoA-[acp] transacylase [Campylobacter helveticus]QBL12077.1 [acyl-carrier-protein] S-malonyltransferase [Campylobacter helveticus]TNB55595.1 ACP S-malonyltransferase [Campylobacter helveticus]TNB58967.1 ACP S-malonyltransferase [Campylobacter helveticus]TNB60952.1 ACP S-malonyltransferase [Campylobacter helveticus]